VWKTGQKIFTRNYEIHPTTRNCHRPRQAHRLSKDGVRRLEEIDHANFGTGNQKISEIVTDQAGAFPVSGSVGTGASESMPMVAELEIRSFRSIREKIVEILDREKPNRWGFATPSEINGAVLDELDDRYRKILQVNLRLDLVNNPASEVLAAFQRD
jgi:hypothetical protein